MTVMHRAIRDKELRAIENKKRTMRGGSPSPQSMASEIWESLDPSLIRCFPEDFYGAEIKDAETIELFDGKARIVFQPLMDTAELVMDGHSVNLSKESRAQLALMAHQCGRRGPVVIPRDAYACAAVLKRYHEYIEQIHVEFNQRVAEKTANEKLAAKVVSLLAKRLGAYGNSTT